MPATWEVSDWSAPVAETTESGTGSDLVEVQGNTEQVSEADLWYRGLVKVQTE